MGEGWLEPGSPAAETEPVEPRKGRRGRRDRGSGSEPTPNMLPGRKRRRTGAERLLVRVIATCGVVGIGVVIAAIMTSSHSQGWIIGLVVAVVSVVLSGVLWSSRQL